MRPLVMLPLAWIVLFPAFATAELLNSGAVTRDTVSGLDWLDLTVTAGLSYDDVVEGAGGWYPNGWRHAFHDEICDLYSQFSGSTPRLPDCWVYIPGWHDNWKVLGQTNPGESTGDRTKGIY